MPLAGFLLIAIFFSITAPSRFLTLRNWLTIMQQSTVIAIVGFGMTFIIVMGSIDISVGSVVALSGMIAADVAQRYGLLWGIASGIVVGSVTGTFNGTALTFLKVPSFIVTLGMLSMARGLTILYSKGKTIAVYETFGFLGELPWILYVVFGVFVIVYIMFNFTIVGRYCRAVGGDEAVAKLTGIPVRLVKVLVFVLGGVLTGLGGVIQTARLGASTPTTGLGLEFEAITAVVLGGTPLTGGIGGVHYTFIGSVITAMLTNGLVILGVPTEGQLVIRGLVLIAAVFVSIERSKLIVIK